MSDRKSRVLILGGGFSGLYAALEFERRKHSDIAVTLVNRDNFFLFTPMLHEIAASDLDITNIVNPVRKMLRHVDFFAGDVESIDLEKRAVVVSHGFDHHTHTLEYDHLVLALGSITNFFQLPGLEARALTMKSLGDAIQLRNRLIAHLEEADTECAAKEREALLTFVVAGGGFAGVETIASINDFLHDVLPFYPLLKPEMLRVVLVHPGDYILPELGEDLGRYADEKLRERGVEVRCKTRVSGVTRREVHLNDGTQLTSFTLIWTAGASPNPTIDLLDCPKERGRLKVNQFLSVGTRPGVWAVGDCALVPDLTTGQFCPPTAQHAVREGKVLAHNILAEIRGTTKKPFKFRTLGQLASIGRRTGVAQILGLKFSGFLAWFLWRGIYWSKLPRMEKKVRVAIDWLLDLLFTKDFTQFVPQRAPVISMTAPAMDFSSIAAAMEGETQHEGVKRTHHENARLNHYAHNNQSDTLPESPGIF